MAHAKKPLIVGEPVQDEELSAREERFCDEYLLDFNATKAAIRSGFSPKSARTQGPFLLRKPSVARELERRKAIWKNRFEVTKENVLAELARLALSDMRRFATWGKKGIVLKSSGGLTDADAAAVAELSQVHDARTGKTALKFKLHDKQGPLNTLAKHVGIIGNEDDGGTAEQKAEAIKKLLDKMDAVTGGGDAGAKDA